MMKTEGLAATEAECAAGRTAPRVSLADIEANIAETHFTLGMAVVGPMGSRYSSLDALTICLLVLQNGFTIIGKAAPASLENFDAALGQKLAYEDAVRQVWPLMGYELRERLHRGEQTAKFQRMDEELNQRPIPIYPTHIERLIVERRELAEKLAKLLQFFASPPVAGVDQAEFDDMRDQAHQMDKYLRILERRLNRAGADDPVENTPAQFAHQGPAAE